MKKVLPNKFFVYQIMDVSSKDFKVKEISRKYFDTNRR